jgi:hypothetical protein
MALGPAQNAQDAHRSVTPSVTKVGTPPLAPLAMLKTVVLTPNAQDAQWRQRVNRWKVCHPCLRPNA